MCNEFESELCVISLTTEALLCVLCTITVTDSYTLTTSVSSILCPKRRRSKALTAHEENQREHWKRFGSAKYGIPVGTFSDRFDALTAVTKSTGIFTS